MLVKVTRIEGKDGRFVNVHFDRDVSEYRVRANGDEASDYFTPNRADALDTARDMATRAERVPGDEVMIILV